jgi:adenine deaminase
LKDLTEWEVLETYVDGIKVAEKGISLIHSVEEKPINHFHANPIKSESLRLHKIGGQKHPVIVALDGQLITDWEEHELKEKEGLLVPDTDRDLLKIVVINRYADATPAVGFIRNFGLKSGAMASSVAHDSHNIVAVGADDESITRAINLVIMEKGGLSCVSDTESRILPLPVGGLMNNIDGYQIAQKYIAIDRMAKALGSGLGAPFMTLSFMALLVIPHLKMSDRGLFNVDKFSFVLRGE